MNRIRFEHLYSSEDAPRSRLIAALLGRYLGHLPCSNLREWDVLCQLIALIEEMISVQRDLSIPPGLVAQMGLSPDQAVVLEQGMRLVFRFPFESDVRSRLIVSGLIKQCRERFGLELGTGNPAMLRLVEVVRAAIDAGDPLRMTPELLGALTLEPRVQPLLEKVLGDIVDDVGPWLWARPTLQFWSLKEALVPFTSNCEPVLVRVRKCWCGCWVKNGDIRCPFCGGPSPTGAACRGWIRTDRFAGQLNLQQGLQPIGPPMIPPSVNADVLLAGLEHGFKLAGKVDTFGDIEPGQYLIAMEQEDHETEWRSGDEQPN